MLPLFPSNGRPVSGEHCNAQHKDCSTMSNEHFAMSIALSHLALVQLCTLYCARKKSALGCEQSEGEGLAFLPTSPREGRVGGLGCHTRLMHPTHANLLLNAPYQQQHSGVGAKS